MTFPPILEACYESHECVIPNDSIRGGFCDYEIDFAGLCRMCSDIKNGCENEQLSKNGELECKAVCEGKLVEY